MRPRGLVAGAEDGGRGKKPEINPTQSDATVIFRLSPHERVRPWTAWVADFPS